MILKNIINRFEKRIIKKKKPSNQIYILPTRNGIYYIIINFLSFMIGLSYRSNIVLLISFILVSYLIMIMVSSNFSLKDMMIKSLKIENNFKSEGINSFFYIENNSKKTISYLRFFIGKKLENEILNIDHVLAFEQKFHQGQNNQFARGYHEGNIIKITCQGPIKLFTTWTYKKLLYDFYVYPSPIKANQKNIANIYKDYSGIILDHEYERHIPYHESLSPRNVDWKYYSKSDQLLWKKSHGSNNSSIKLIYQPNQVDQETHLGELTWLIKWAYFNKVPWELSILESKYGPSLRRDHYQQSLERLSVL